MSSSILWCENFHKSISPLRLKEDFLPLNVLYFCLFAVQLTAFIDWTEENQLANDNHTGSKRRTILLYYWAAWKNEKKLQVEYNNEARQPHKRRVNCVVEKIISAGRGGGVLNRTDSTDRETQRNDFMTIFF